eukprot:s8199_g3.t1
MRFAESKAGTPVCSWRMPTWPTCRHCRQLFGRLLRQFWQRQMRRVGNLQRTANTCSRAMSGDQHEGMLDGEGCLVLASRCTERGHAGFSRLVASACRGRSGMELLQAELTG